MGLNKYFFGISQFNFTTYSASILFLDTTNPANLAQNYQYQNIDFIYFFAYFRSKRTCPASNYYISATGMCDTSCPIGKFANSAYTYCQSCYYTCGTCVSALQT